MAAMAGLECHILTSRSVNDYAVDGSASPEMCNTFYHCHSDMVLKANEGKRDALHPSLTHLREFRGQ